MEGVCFIDSNEEAMAFAVLTLKGNVVVYKVKNTYETTMIDACSIDWQTSISDVIK